MIKYKYKFKIICYYVGKLMKTFYNQAGGLGMKDYKNYDGSIPKELQEETYLLYDEKNLGPGFFIVTKENDAIKNFVNISLSREALCSRILVRGYEKNLSQSPEEEFQTIKITVKNDNPLFSPLNVLSKKLMGRKISSINPYEQGKNHMKITPFDDTIILTIAKDIIRVSDDTNFIDITLDNTFACLFYNDMLSFYEELSQLAPKSVTEKDIKQLLLTK